MGMLVVDRWVIGEQWGWEGRTSNNVVMWQHFGFRTACEKSCDPFAYIQCKQTCTLYGCLAQRSCMLPLWFTGTSVRFSILHFFLKALLNQCKLSPHGIRGLQLIITTNNLFSRSVRVLYSPPHIPAGIRRNLVDSSRFWEFRGMEILAVLPAKIVISVPQNSGRFQNGPRITRTELTGMESPELFLIVILIFFNSNSNYLVVIRVNY